MSAAMPSSDHMLQVYRDLADWHERQGLDQLRDRFLVLAAASAHAAGQTDEAERLRQRLLLGNADHPLRPFTSLAQALRSSDVQTHVEDLRQEYPLHAAEDLLASVRGNSPPPPPRRSQAGTLPPTAPVINLGKQAEPLKVFRDPEDGDVRVPILPAWDEAARPPTRKTSLPSPRPSRVITASPVARPATVAVKRYAGQEPNPKQPPKPLPVESEHEEESGGSWVALVLFVLVLAAAMFLGIVTLVQPFVP